MNEGIFYLVSTGTKPKERRNKSLEGFSYLGDVEQCVCVCVYVCVCVCVCFVRKQLESLKYIWCQHNTDLESNQFIVYIHCV